MGDPSVGRHWLLGVLDRTGRLPLDTPALAPTTSLVEAWVAAVTASMIGSRSSAMMTPKL